MLEENVVSQAGATFRMTEAQIRRVIGDLGYTPRRRNMFYELLPESGIQNPESRDQRA
jgi:cyclic dehypoxanthinyl futalosine synthase